MPRKYPTTMTPRRLQVARLIGVGLTLREIAELLEISPETVKVHKREIWSVLECENRNDLDDWLFEQGYPTRNTLARKVMHDLIREAEGYPSDRAA